MAEHYLYLTTIGRKTGYPRQIEIWYVEHDSRYYLISEHGDRSHWVRNIMNDPAVTLSIGTRDENDSVMQLTPARARIASAEEDSELVTKIKALMDAKYSWSTDFVVELTPELPGPAAPF